MNIPLFSLRNKALILILLLLITAWGALNYSQISRREDPEIKISIALVITIWPGASAEKTERLVTTKLEENIETISEVETITSMTRDNLSVIMVEVTYESDVDMAWQRLRNKLAEVEPDLPSGLIGPDVMDDFGDVTAMIYTLSSPTRSAKELEELADELRSELREIESVGKVVKLGTQEEFIYIEGPLDSFSLYGYSPLALMQILDYQNVNVPAGNVRAPTRNYRLEPTGSFNTLDQLREAVVDVSEGGAPLKIRDIFTVRRAPREPAFDKLFANGIPAVGLDIRMKDGYNIVAMGAEIKAKVAEFEKRLPDDVHLVLQHDQPRHVDHFINEFMVNLVEGLIIVVLVLLFSMGIRTATVIAISLPLSIIFTFALMPLFSVDLETVSIASFIIALGMLVDNAIIVVDNIYAHMERGAPRFEACWRGVQELLAPLITGTLGTVFAFLPLLIMKAEPGAYVRSLPIVVSISLLGSLILAVTITPILAYWVLRVKAKKPKPGQEEQSSAQADTETDTAVAADQAEPSAAPRGPYAGLMRLSFKLRYLVILAALGSLAGSFWLLKEVGFSFFPEAYRDQFIVNIWLPEGASIDKTESTTKAIEAILQEDEDVTDFVSFVGKGGPRFFISVKPEFNTSNFAQIIVNTTGPDKTDALIDRLNRRMVEEIPGARATASKLLMGIPVEAPVAFRVTGPELSVAKRISQQIQEIFEEAQGSANVRDNLGNEVASFEVDIDTDSLSMVGITATEVALTLLTAYDGLPITKYRQGDDELEIYLRLREEDRDINNALRGLRVPSQVTGAKVPLAAFSSVKPEWGPGIIRHTNSRRSVTAMADLQVGYLADDLLKETRPQIESLPLPPGYELESVGEDAERDKAFGELIIIFALIIVALLVLLVVQFSSLSRALVILSSVPLAIIGRHRRPLSLPQQLQLHGILGGHLPRRHGHQERRGLGRVRRGQA